MKALEQSFDELNATHERLVDAHEKLVKAHTKLEKAHSLLLEEKKEKVAVSCDVGTTCDLIKESPNLSIVLPLTLLVGLHPPPLTLPLLLVMV